MASSQRTADFIVEQIAGAGHVSARKMFGEYGVYCDSKVVALICDDQLFVKPTQAGRAHIGAVTQGHPFPGAKPWLLIADEHWDNAEWLTQLIAITTAELPTPKAKKPARKKRRAK